MPTFIIPPLSLSMHLYVYRIIIRLRIRILLILRSISNIFHHSSLKKTRNTRFIELLPTTSLLVIPIEG